jgi:hypothetical protein
MDAGSTQFDAAAPRAGAPTPGPLRERYRNIVRVQILPEWDRVRLSAISHADVVAWVAKLVADGYAASTVRQVHRVFSLMLDWLSGTGSTLDRGAVAR